MEEATEQKDSREKIEKEVQHYYIWYSDRKRIIEWLDRQAAITEQEAKLRELYKFEENHRWHVRTLEETIQELSERIDALTRAVKERERAIDQMSRYLKKESVDLDFLNGGDTAYVITATDGTKWMWCSQNNENECMEPEEKEKKDDERKASN